MVGIGIKNRFTWFPIEPKDLVNPIGTEEIQRQLQNRAGNGTIRPITENTRPVTFGGQHPSPIIHTCKCGTVSTPVTANAPTVQVILTQNPVYNLMEEQSESTNGMRVSAPKSKDSEDCSIPEETARMLTSTGYSKSLEERMISQNS